MITTDRRVLMLMAIAIIVGTAAVGSAWALLKLITLCTNLAYYGRLTLDVLPVEGSPWWRTVFVPVEQTIAFFMGNDNRRKAIRSSMSPAL